MRERVHHFFDWLGRVETSTARSRPGRCAWVRSSSSITGRARRSGAWMPSAGSARQIPAYYPLLPLLRVPPIARKIDRETRGCEDGTCGIPEPQPQPEHQAAGRA